jgi:iron complex outermembrane receptor protein
MKRTLLISAAWFLAQPTTPALAQVGTSTPIAEEENNVGEVVVVARRREERLRDVPVAASVVDAETIAARGGVTDPEKLLQGTPGVRYVNTASPTTAETSIRASGTSRGTFAESAIGLYRDGVYVGGGLLGGRNFTRADLFDIERAEVVRGTQSALYGRNAIGGAINIITKKPQFEDGGFIDAKYGFNNEQAQIQGSVNKKLSDRWAIRVGAQLFDQNGGFFYNRSRGEFFDVEKGHVVRAQVRYQGDLLSVNALYENQVANLPALNWQIVAAKSTTFPSGYVSDKRKYDWGSPSLAKQQVNTAILAIDYFLGWGTLTSTTSFRNRLTKNAFDQDSLDAATYAKLRAQGLVAAGVDVNAAQWSQDEVRTYYQDVHIVGQRNGKLDWLAGAELLRIEDDYDQDNARTPTLANKSLGSSQPAQQEINSYAVYGTAGLKLTDAFSISGELRYADDKKDFYSERVDLTTRVSAGSRFLIDGVRKSENVTYNLIASYKVNGWLGYAKVGSAYRTGGFNRDLGDPRAPRPVVPGFGDELAVTYEVGAKGSLAPNVYVEGAAYRTVTDDLIVQLDNGCGLQNPSCPVAATSYVVNAGEGHSWGVEMFVNTHFKVGPGLARLNVGGSRQEGEVVSGPFDGSSFPQVPDWVASATLNYRLPVWGATTLSTNLAYRGQWGGIQEITGVPKLSDYQQVDARAALDFGQWEAAVYANNAANNTYVNFGNVTLKRWSQPRVYGVQLRYKW